MTTTKTKQLLTAMCKYTTNLLNTPDINLHVDYDGYSALVYEADDVTIYFVFSVDIENKTFIMGIHYFNNHLEPIFKEDKKYNSLTVALNEIVSIIETLNKLTNVRK